MEVQKANRELLVSPIMGKIVPASILDLLIQRLSEGALMNVIICDSVPVGFVTLIDLATNELMTVIHQDYRRKGYVFKACIQTINESFHDLGLKHVTVKTLTNSPSFFLAKKLGFKEDKTEGKETHLTLTETTWESITHFHLSSEEENRLREACFKLASQVNWTKTTDTENIGEQVDKIAIMTGEVYECTIYYLLANISLGCDAEMMIRIVNYITDVHAVPVSSCDIDWYRTTLWTLVELACPNYEIGDSDFDFIEIDIRKRVNKEI
jgi:hypothetical protein